MKLHFNPENKNSSQWTFIVESPKRMPEEKVNPLGRDYLITALKESNYNLFIYLI